MNATKPSRHLSLPSDAWTDVARRMPPPLWGLLRCVCKEAREGVDNLRAEHHHELRRDLGLNEIQSEIYTSVVHRGERVFVTGGAGCGKSFATRHVMDAVASSFLDMKFHPPRRRDGTVPEPVMYGRVAACTPTGSASQMITTALVPAYTIHRLFNIRNRQRDKSSPAAVVQLFQSDDDEDDPDEMEESAKQGIPTAVLNTHALCRLRALKLLVIDEVSMASCEKVELINDALQMARKSNEPFGGVRLMVVGDFFQLPPVIDAREKARTCGRVWAFEAKDWSVLRPIELVEVVRHSDDHEFCVRLNRVRKGRHTAQDVQWLNQNSRSTGGSAPSALYCHNKKCHQHNQLMLDGLYGLPEFRYVPQRSCYYRVKADNPDLREILIAEDLLPKAPVYPRDPDDEVPLVFKLGARVRQTRNHYVGHNHYRKLLTANGQTGTISRINSEGFEVTWDGISDAIKTRKGMPPRVRWAKRQQFKLNKENCPAILEHSDVEKKDYSCFAAKSQFPIALCWARTVHTSQGTTITTNVDIDVSGKFPNSVGNWVAQAGMTYVAISRATHLGLVRFLTPLKMGDIVVDRKVQLYDRDTFGLGGEAAL